MSQSIWAVILCLGAGTYLLRFSFLGLIGSGDLPNWVLRLLRYVPVAVLPALVAPMVVWPAAANGVLDPPRMIAALVGLAIGAATRSVLGAIGGGMVSLYLALWIFA